MRWNFPEHRFQITDKDGTWSDCVLVGEDEESITFDYTAANNGARMRCQMRKEDIRSMSFSVPPVFADDVSRLLKDR